MKKILLSLMCAIGFSSIAHAATTTVQPVSIAFSVIASSISNQAGGGVVSSGTLTQTGGYNSTGLYDYVTNIHIEMYATGTLTGGATPVTCTTTNLSGMAFKLPTAAATGTTTVVDMQFANPAQGVQGNAVTVTCPATASVIWNVTLGYYTAN